jgi:hypothetical protein
MAGTFSAVNIDGSTSTNPVRDSTPEIKFHSSMTYSEKLLLKKHRRTELETLSTPGVDLLNRPISGGHDFGKNVQHLFFVKFKESIGQVPL